MSKTNRGASNVPTVRGTKKVRTLLSIFICEVWSSCTNLFMMSTRRLDVKYADDTVHLKGFCVRSEHRCPSVFTIGIVCR